jgi:hypothetical protein
VLPKKKEKKGKAFLVVVVVVVVTVVLVLSNAIVIETIPWHTGLIPPSVSSLEHEAKQVGENSTHRSDVT